MLDDGVGSIVALDVKEDVASEEGMAAVKEIGEDARESEDALKLASSLNVFMYLVDEDMNEDAVVVENAEELSVKLELCLELSSELRNLVEVGEEEDDDNTVHVDAEGGLKVELELELELILELLIELMEAETEVAGTGVTKMIEVIVATILTDSVEDKRNGVVDKVFDVDRITGEDRVGVDEVDGRLLVLSSSLREVFLANALTNSKKKIIRESRKRIITKASGDCYWLAIGVAIYIVRVTGRPGCATFLGIGGAEQDDIPYLSSTQLRKSGPSRLRCDT